MNKEPRKVDQDRPSYKETLNLLQTNFGMRANAPLREPELQSFWKEKGIDFELGLSNQGETFTLHDGPPYANGSLHMGHALNKILKDIINKFHIMRGRKVRFVPGWDCHGLPIELKVLQSLDKQTRESLTALKLRKKAGNYARKQVSNQMAGFQRWGVWADWGNPYLTLNKDYEASQLRLFGQMALKGYIYRGLKPVHWSPSSRTALAEAELEYPDGHISPSVYVAFDIVDLKSEFLSLLSNQGVDISNNNNKLYSRFQLAIWTTTPWTLPANLAVSVNSSLDYVIAEGNNRLIIIAAELLTEFTEKTQIDLTVRAKVKGSEMEGISYINPLDKKVNSVVIGGEYITTDSGTGLVHTAPGHGIDDFNTGQKYGLPVVCPVNEKGIMTEEAGLFAGLNVLKDANEVIIKELDRLGSLIKEMPYEHRYPYDWRTKKPTIFRATEQWFASVEGFRDQALNAIDLVDWVPASGRNRIHSMVRERGDWCISRQRTWGVPIPVFYEKDGNDILLNEETLAHIQSLVEKNGADIWWQLDEVDLLPDSYSNQAHRWRKGTDTMDVWFDSGSSWSAVTSSADDLSCPADLYLEGSDQHRGWFQSSLLTSVAVNKKAPYKKVLTHGFVLDENGRKMSKSLGNIVDPSEIINGGNNKKLNPAFGADVLRLWVSSVDYSVDVPIGENILRQTSDIYRKVRNTARYLLGNLYDFNPELDQIPIRDLPLIDRWMINRTAEVLEEIKLAFENYEFSKFFQILQSFCVIDLSNFYLDIAKDRLYVSSKSEYRRRSCQTVLSLIIESLSVSIAPVLCHMAEDIWQNIPYPIKEESVFMRGWPEIDKTWRFPSLNPSVIKIRELRTSVNRLLESCRSNNLLGSSLEAAVRIDVQDNTFADAIDWLHQEGDRSVDVLRDWLLVSHCQIGGEPWAEIFISEQTDCGVIEIAKARGVKCDRCWHYETNTGSNSNKENICDRCFKIMSEINN